MSDAHLRDLERASAMGDIDAQHRLEAHKARMRAGEIREPRKIMLNHDHPDLVALASMNEDGLSYEFHTMMLCRHTPSLRVFWGEDSGCSCPAPWEDDWFQFDGVTLDTSLNELTQASLSAFERQANGFPADIGDRSRFIHAARQAIQDVP